MSVPKKPIVKYRTSTYTFCGEKHKIKSKLTLLLRFEGPLAKKWKELSDGNGKKDLHWSYWNTPGKERLEVYEDEEIEDKIIKPKGAKK